MQWSHNFQACNQRGITLTLYKAIKILWINKATDSFRISKMLFVSLDKCIDNMSTAN